MNDAFDYIEKAYGLRFAKHMIVRALGKPGVVTGTESAHVMVRLSEAKHAMPYHPSDVAPLIEVEP